MIEPYFCVWREFQTVRVSMMKVIKSLLIFGLFFCPGTVWAASPQKGFFGTVYRFSDGDIGNIAQNFDLILVGTDKASQVASMKSIKSDLKALYYKNALTHGNTYYVQDVNTGKRCVQKDWGWYLMDISNSNYRSDLANSVSSTLSTYPQFDGVLLDDVWPSMSGTSFYQEGTTTDCTLPSSLTTNTSFQTYMMALMDAIKVAISNGLIIANTQYYCYSGGYGGNNCADYLSHLDGIAVENFAHSNWQDANTFSSSGLLPLQLSSMTNAIAAGKYWLAQSGVLDGATPDQISNLVKYAYAASLMGMDRIYAKHYFCPSMQYAYYWYPVWDISIGSSTGAYFRISGKNSLRRDFSNGIVLVNPSDSDETIPLDSWYQTSGGQSVNSLTLPARRGEILLNSIAPPTSPANLRIIN